MFLPLLILAAAPLSQASAPISDPATWITSDDYPSTALRAAEQGTVAFTLRIDAGGAVTACTVEISSGSAALDETTCNVMRTRARFRPARDQRGRAIPSTSYRRVVWMLPRDDEEEAAPPPVDIATMPAVLGFEAEIAVDSDGKVISCHVVEHAGVSLPLGNTFCLSHPFGHQETPPMLRGGRPVGATLRSVISQTIRFDP